MLALRDVIPLRDALERLGIDTAPLDLPPPPEAVPFAHIPPGHAFTWQDHVWSRATLDQAIAATADRRAQPLVVAAYLAATQRRQAATAFRWHPDATHPVTTCLAERVEADDLVTPAAPSRTPATLPTPQTWISTADRLPDLGRTVTVDMPAGPTVARLLLDDESSDGAAWVTARGERLDLDEVSRWQPLT